MIFFFFSSRRRHTRCYRDWSSDVCSSDLRDTVRNIIRELRDMVVAGLDAVITFQKLQIRLEQFASREVLIKGVGNAMQETTKLAKGLLDWVKKLSLTVPFSTETLANTLSLNMAMGFTSNQARELTVAIAAY